MYTCVYLFDSAVDERSLSLSLSHTHTLSLSLGESVLTDSKQISNAFHDQFSSIGPKINKGVQPTSVSPESYVQPTTSQLEFKLIDVSEVHSLLSGLSVTKASGLDRISARLLKDAATLISEPLCSIFIASLSQDIFPDSWKTAKVFPIYKGNAKSEHSNYRPISVLTILAKVFEKIVFNQLYS